MTAFLIILVFIIFAALMISRRMPAILAVPAMAVAAIAARTTKTERMSVYSPSEIVCVLFTRLSGRLQLM